MAGHTPASHMLEDQSDFYIDPVDLPEDGQDQPYSQSGQFEESSFSDAYYDACYDEPQEFPYDSQFINSQETHQPSYDGSFLSTNEGFQQIEPQRTRREEYQVVVLPTHTNANAFRNSLLSGFGSHFPDSTPASDSFYQNTHSRQIGLEPAFSDSPAAYLPTHPNSNTPFPHESTPQQTLHQHSTYLETYYKNPLQSSPSNAAVPHPQKERSGHCPLSQSTAHAHPPPLQQPATQDSSPAKGRKGPLSEENKNSANNTRKLGSCCWCRIHKQPCVPGSETQHCQTCVANQRPCYRLDKKKLLKLINLDEGSFLEICRKFDPDTRNMTLAINLKLISQDGHRKPEKFPIPLHGTSASDGRFCPLSNLSIMDMDTFIDRFNELSTKPLPFIPQGRTDAFDLAKHCLGYTAVLKQLPRSRCDRSRQYLDLGKIKRVIGALFRFIVRRIQKLWTEAVEKITEMVYPSKIPAWSRQDFHLLSLAAIVRVSDELAGMSQLSQQKEFEMFSALTDLSAQMRLILEEITRYAQATYSGIIGDDSPTTSFVSLKNLVWPSDDKFSLDISYNSSSLYLPSRSIRHTTPSIIGKRNDDQDRSTVPKATVLEDLSSSSSSLSGESNSLRVDANGVDLLRMVASPQDSDEHGTANKLFTMPLSDPYEFATQDSVGPSPGLLANQFDHEDFGQSGVIDPSLLSKSIETKGGVASSEVEVSELPKQSLTRRQTNDWNNPAIVPFSSRGPIAMPPSGDPSPTVTRTTYFTEASQSKRQGSTPASSVAESSKRRKS